MQLESHCRNTLVYGLISPANPEAQRTTQDTLVSLKDVLQGQEQSKEPPVVIVEKPLQY
jgi:hypothetical protein